MAYVGVAADLLDGGLVEVARVAEEAADIVGVLQTLKDGLDQGLLASLAKLEALIALLGVDVLDPRVVVGSGIGRDVLLELDDVRVRNVLGVGRGEDGSGIAMDGADGEGGGGVDGSSRGNSTGEDSHDGGGTMWST